MTEGNVCIQIPEDEAALLVFFDPLFSFTKQDRRWMRAEQPQDISPVIDIPTTVPHNASAAIGMSRDNPTSENAPVATDTGLALSVVSVTRDAWLMVHAENQFNDPPKEGRRFLLITLSVENVSGGSEEISVRAHDFRIVGTEARLLTTFQHGCGVMPDALAGSLFEGGATTGNICFEVGMAEKDFTLLYEPLFSFSEASRRWLSLGPAGD